VTETTPATPSTENQKSTPLPVIADVSRIVTKVVDQITGDRSDYPLLTAFATVEALGRYGYPARVVYGQAAWLEVLEDSSLIWSGCWGEQISFWVVTELGEVVDLNLAVAHRKRSHQDPGAKPLYSPPNLWSKDVPRFLEYRAEGVAELELDSDRDREWLEKVSRHVEDKCTPSKLGTHDDLDFPNEAMICPGRRLLDDTGGRFKHFDRALGVHGIPEGPLTGKPGSAQPPLAQPQ
jgi:hypothetical protein